MATGPIAVSMPARPTRILVSIRYPITAQSAHTLQYAEEIAQTYDDGAQLLLLHVNLIQNNDSTREGEIRQAVGAILNETYFSVITRQGFLLEETILDEARERGVDIIVVGKNQAPRWRQLLSKIFFIGPNIVSYLEENTGSDIIIEVVE